MPSKFPFDTFAVMGLLRAVKDMKPNHLESVMSDMFDLIWQHGNGEVTHDALKTAVSPYFDGQEMSLLMERATHSNTREVLRNEAKELVAQGAFGFPYVRRVTLTLDGSRPCVHWIKMSALCMYISLTMQLRCE